MTDEVWKRDEVESPCIKICVIHPETRLCTGCMRSTDEIGAWSRMAPDLRRAIMDELPGRAGLLGKRRGGRAARLAQKS
ncbi:DUF1289 domain-containing protein [Sulfitobacter sp. SK012]|uniref:DUF1289 domain-containing protein n=1 Tax=Sulfitobacter sp. SK012 TaxID=1389005 RepID=UPI000E0A94A9|nr:DUF1289 domain-containing protein [Sulfitobacter sp. SK012]AXI47297.1 DUF1289 domain-containing protein [Sulfitobacter sp. SK012]